MGLFDKFKAGAEKLFEGAVGAIVSGANIVAGQKDKQKTAGAQLGGAVEPRLPPEMQNTKISAPTPQTEPNYEQRQRVTVATDRAAMDKSFGEILSKHFGEFKTALETGNQEAFATEAGQTLLAPFGVLQGGIEGLLSGRGFGAGAKAQLQENLGQFDQLTAARQQPGGQFVRGTLGAERPSLPDMSGGLRSDIGNISKFALELPAEIGAQALIGAINIGTDPEN